MRALAILLASAFAAGSAHAEAWYPGGQVRAVLDGMDAAHDRLRSRQAEFMTRLAAAAQAPPVNAGFKSLGAAGATGKVDGPNGQSDGTYKVIANDPAAVSIRIATGYIDGVITLSRDAATGKDSMRFAGKLWKDDAWGPAQDTVRDAAVSYSPEDDKGTINWSEDGKAKEQAFRDGGDDDGKMTMDFDGWGHAFIRD